ncbi:hypothetical protein ABF162_08855 [Vibrio coralliilyticus]|uniref:hypothetical protein n=1 Tax=Vibrio coralliilyticus TaxID=190893 RepID=UPI0005127E47|nr:hypothetical protein [Vibrio coralliilyticus]AIU67094.1 hypothetical protein JV59_32820 [Vibrio coralliilyticus]
MADHFELTKDGVKIVIGYYKTQLTKEKEALNKVIAALYHDPQNVTSLQYEEFNKRTNSVTFINDKITELESQLLHM